MASDARKASSANEGFFQTAPTLENQFYDDASYQRILKLFLPKEINETIAPDLSRLGREVLSKRIFDWVTDAERNVPYLKGSGRDAFGRQTSELVVTEGWRELQKFGIENGIVAAGYEGEHREYSRVAQFLKTHLWTGSNANVTCPSAMTDGAAKLLLSHLRTKTLDTTTREVFQDAYDRVTSRNCEFAWTSGQWMTERSGGSDVSGTETIAIYSPIADGLSASDQILGHWSIDGFKWFSSATDSSMTILLAQTSKGLSAFFAPIYRMVAGSSSQKELNGVHIQRLKNKSGTKSLPTAELELRGMRGYLIGKEGQGIQEISTILNITRLYSAVSTVGYVGRGLAIAKAFTRVREVGAGKGKRVKLFDSPLHMSTLAKLTGEYHSMMLFTFFVAWLIGINEHGSSAEPGPSTSEDLRPNSADVPLLLRIMTPVLKGSVCKRCTYVLQECMEALGGVGYLDNSENEAINIARLYRDCCVNSIWEGTTDVLATDSLRVLKGGSGDKVLKALDRWITKALSSSKKGQPALGNAKDDLIRKWQNLKAIVKEQTSEDLLALARGLLFQVADVIMGVLFFADSQQDVSSLSAHMCLDFLERKAITKEQILEAPTNWRKVLERNQAIVFGAPVTSPSEVASKL
ncbi:acyl-CoA dehydrogenase/oxidase C-terminal [Mollisia scopiformis]|uniref:Acyl-CoA dehydrogenase/oxidase C-terminal n=1 Tax=Mollisia scopiformis TaxID=149040 RepID=A0A132B5S5_MOLSC|nr:acyl-CoA dehydrogenase/oxidase C-terminal [Mollisia scopiformis]KUJ07766.1 acyl-CoA dehydrogenase/oxidase C-terminal [Mollisia scopiformis]